MRDGPTAVGTEERAYTLPAGTVTFLFTDIEGSTLLLERLREGYATVLADQRDLLRAAFAERNGFEVDTQGDSFFVAFPRAADALMCALEAQRALQAHQWPDGTSVRVRMGLHTGEPTIARTGYVGMDVHRAARIAASGHGGQVLLSRTVRDLVAGQLPDGASLIDLGAHRLKDVRQALEIFQLSAPDLPHDFPPLRTLATGDEPPTPGEPPYKGLQYFDREDADLFFGREQLTARLMGRIRDERFLAVVGASGSGKSSIVRAGLIPALHRDSPQAWRIHVITPTAHPLEALALGLSSDGSSVADTAALIDDLRRDARTLHLVGMRLVASGGRGGSLDGPGPARVLLVVDQFEEMFTLCRDPAERGAFVEALLTAVAPEGPTSVVLTLRADFYAYLAGYAELRDSVAAHQQYIGPMNAQELRRAIEAPADRAGWEFSPGLVDLILRDVGQEPGALPLLSHALLETWRCRRGTVLTLKAYAESGGVRGAIARTADRVYHVELTSDQQRIARDIFLRLTELGEGTQDTRRRVGLRELVPATSANAAAVETSCAGSSRRGSSRPLRRPPRSLTRRSSASGRRSATGSARTGKRCARTGTSRRRPRSGSCSSGTLAPSTVERGWLRRSIGPRPIPRCSTSRSARSWTRRGTWPCARSSKSRASVDESSRPPSGLRQRSGAEPKSRRAPPAACAAAPSS